MKVSYIPIIKIMLTIITLLNNSILNPFNLLLNISAKFVKFLPSIKLAIIFSIPTWSISTISNWTLTNQDYLLSVLACIAIDHLIGTIYHAIKLRDFTFRKNAIGLIKKIGLCVLAIGLFEIIHNTIKDVALIYDYLKITTRLVVILYPASSAFMNMSYLTNGRFPPIGWINRIKIFNENLNIESLKHPTL